MINEEQATGLRAGDDAHGHGTACGDLSSELILGEGVLLPLGLIGALVVADSDEPPVVGEGGELICKQGHEASLGWPSDIAGR